MSDITIKVKTEQLANCADDAERKIRNLRNSFQKIGDCVNKSRNYWTGEGNNAHIKKYVAKIEKIEQALARLDENVADLREVAGIYVKAEASSVRSTEVLPFDVII